MLIDSFHRYLEEISFFAVKTINNLLLPRQKKENLKANDRSVDTSNIEEVFNRSPTEAITYNTDESINFSVQVGHFTSHPVCIVLHIKAFARYQMHSSKMTKLLHQFTKSCGAMSAAGD